MRNILILLIFAILLCNCNQNPADKYRKNAIEQFDMPDEQKIVNITDTLQITGNPKMIVPPEYEKDNIHAVLFDNVFDSVFVVNLQTTPNCIVGEISELEIVADTIYIRDGNTKSVFSFGMDGKFLHKFGSIGEGPGEYIEPTFMSVNSGCVLIYDQWQQKLLKYDHIGNLLSESRPPFYCNDVLMLNDTSLLWYVQAHGNYHLPSVLNYSFCICDTSFSKIYKVGLYSDNEKTLSMGESQIFTNNGRVYYFDCYHKNIYEILPDGNLAHLVCISSIPDYGEDWDTYKQNRADGAVIVADFFVTGSHAIYCMAADAGYSQYVYHSMIDNTVIAFNGTRCDNSQISRAIWSSYPLGVYKNSVVYSLCPSSIIGSVEHGNSTGHLWDGASDACREFDKKLLESLHDEDNPILVFAKIKDHFD